MAHLEAIVPADVTKIGIGVIVGLIVLGFVLSMIVTAIIARLVIALVVVVLAVLVWQQRTSVKDDLTKRACDKTSASFFGITVDPPDDVKQYCAQPGR